MVVTKMEIGLKLPADIAKDYSSPAQRIRVMTEEWVSRAGFQSPRPRKGVISTRKAQSF